MGAKANERYEIPWGGGMQPLIRQQLESFLRNKRRTLLGVGPMSLNCVDAAIELANEYNIPIPLIASRRQVDAAEFGGGYVNGWTTGNFARYVKTHDTKGNILLARDHGGPWQNDKEKEQKLSIEQAMQSAKASYLADLEAGFDALHIDPSVDIHGHPDVDTVLGRVFELYGYCWEQAQHLGRDVIFEIGTEEQSGNLNSPEELHYTLDALQSFCSKSRMPMPAFVVIQCGTRVMETRNIGAFGMESCAGKLPEMIEICNRYGVFAKEHNTDYLSDEALQSHPALGIHAANVAPEFGVTETRALISVLEEHGLDKLAEQFMALSYASNRWRKWMVEGSQATDRERAIIAGHYVFSMPECVALKQEAAKALQAKNIALEPYLKAQVKHNILRYLRHFNLVGAV